MLLTNSIVGSWKGK